MKYKLNIEIAFTDKITAEKYKVGDVKEFDEIRAKQLLEDKRHLVSLNEIIKEKTNKSKNVENKNEENKNVSKE